MSQRKLIYYMAAGVILGSLSFGPLLPGSIAEKSKIIGGVILLAFLVATIADRFQQKNREIESLQSRVQLLRERTIGQKEGVNSSTLERIKRFFSLEAGNTVAKITDIIEEKKNRVLNIPNIAFHYANKDQITNFYNDYFKEPTLASLVSEITGEATGEVKGSIPKILESKIGAKDIEKWVSTIKLPDTSLNGMFLRYQRETIKSDQVTIGLEEVDIELSDLAAFDESIDNLRKKFGLVIDPQILNKQKAMLKERAAERTLTKLEQATGWVLIEGRFEIARQDGFYKCTYKHPVTEYLSDPATPILISVMIPEDSLEPSFKGNYAQSVGRLIPLRIYGQVWQPIDRKTRITELQLTPLAVY